MGRWPRDIDHTVNQAEDFLYLAREVERAGRACRMLKRAASLEEKEDDEVHAIVWQSTKAYMALVKELVETVEEVAHNPLFWSEEIPIGQRAGLAVLLNSPVKPERVEA